MSLGDDNPYGQGAVDDNPIEQLDELPDRLLLGFLLALTGLLLLGIDYFWPRLWPASFRTTNTAFVNSVGQRLAAGHGRARQPLTPSGFLFLAGLLCEIMWRVHLHSSRSLAGARTAQSGGH
jgi:hypothetical protein